MRRDVDVTLDLGPETVDLYECDGEVTPIRDFVTANLDILAGHEADIVLANIGALPGPGDIPEGFRSCLTRSRELAVGSIPVFSALRSGARSAFVPEKHLQLKGCRPVLDGKEFPAEILPFGDRKIIRGRIPFGVMTVEAIIREVLGYCFMQKHDLPTQAIPLAATTFHHAGNAVGYGMLLRLRSEDRVESHVEDPHCTIHDVIAAQTGGISRRPELVVGSELSLKGLNLWKYVEAKGRILAAMNCRGGFRGILNSNIGNDVLVPSNDNTQELALADLDTFFVVPIAHDPTPEFIDSFVLQCLVEVAVGSLPIVQYVELPDGCPHGLRADALGAVYFTKSSLWRSYSRYLLTEAAALGWSVATVVDSIERMRRTEAFADILGSRILSGESVKRAENERLFHYFHN